MKWSTCAGFTTKRQLMGKNSTKENRIITCARACWGNYLWCLVFCWKRDGIRHWVKYVARQFGLPTLDYFLSLYRSNGNSIIYSLKMLRHPIRLPEKSLLYPLHLFISATADQFPWGLRGTSHLNKFLTHSNELLLIKGCQ